MLDGDLMLTVMLALGALAVASLAFAVLQPIFAENREADRLAGVTESKANRRERRATAEQATSRKKAVAATIKELDSRRREKDKITMRLRLQRAGLEVSPQGFWIASALTGVAVGILTYLSLPGFPPAVALAAAFAGAFGVPRFVVARMTKRRQTKFLDEFANAIDVIVRGVKSGLPLNECLGIIGRESPEPVAGEFRELVEQGRVGVTIHEGFERMMSRMPLPEVKFFGIVIAIQSQAGGNLSEALGNLSGVLRDRKRLSAKVSALSAEAKASAAVLGSLPIIVMTMVYITTPAYISLLWTTRVGQMLLVASGVWMLIGILVMRKMINFKY